MNYLMMDDNQQGHKEVVSRKKKEERKRSGIWNLEFCCIKPELYLKRKGLGKIVAFRSNLAGKSLVSPCGHRSSLFFKAISAPSI